MATKGKEKELSKPIITRSSSQASVQIPSCVKVQHIVLHSDNNEPVFYLFEKGEWKPHKECSIFQTCKNKFILQQSVDWVYIPVTNDYTFAVGTKKITAANYFPKKE